MTNVDEIEWVAKKYSQLKKSGNDAELGQCVRELQKVVHARKSEIFSKYAGAH